MHFFNCQPPGPKCWVVLDWLCYGTSKQKMIIADLSSRQLEALESEIYLEFRENSK